MYIYIYVWRVLHGLVCKEGAEVPAPAAEEADDEDDDDDGDDERELAEQMHADSPSFDANSYKICNHSWSALF